MKSEKINTNNAQVWMRDEDIIQCRVKPDAKFTIAEAEEILNVVKKLTKGKKHPALVDISKIKSVDKETRDYVADSEFASVNLCVALIVNSPVSKIVGNFFMGLNKPMFPIKLFNSEDKALIWLNEYKEKQG